jgi:predicted nuclease of predicted toxin-antitoxin system
MKFLIDEDVPVKLLRVLIKAGHEATRVRPSTPDPAIAAQAFDEGRILITVDHDFANKSLYPPERFTIVHIRIHPPYADDIVDAFAKLLAELSPERFKGLILLGRASSMRVLE